MKDKQTNDRKVASMCQPAHALGTLQTKQQCLPLQSL